MRSLAAALALLLLLPPLAAWAQVPVSSSGGPSYNQSQADTLLAFKTSFANSAQVLASWVNGTDPCSPPCDPPSEGATPCPHWYGVACDNCTWGAGQCVTGM